jgi:hypothetical protein
MNIGAVMPWVVLGAGLLQAATAIPSVCEALSCQPGDILRFEPEPAERGRPAAAGKPRAGR